MGYKVIVVRITNNIEYGFQAEPDRLDRRHLALIEKRVSDRRVVEVVIVKEKVEYLIYARHQPMLTLALP